MKQWLRTCLATTTVMLSSFAFAAFHLFTIEQVYSNADGTVQFVVLTTSTNGEDAWSLGARLVATPTGGAPRTASLTRNLPSSNTAGKRVLVASQGFADLGLITPDFIISNNFIPTGPAKLEYSPGSSSNMLVWQALPTDGVNSLYPSGVMPNLATNFAGQQASISARRHGTRSQSARLDRFLVRAGDRWTGVRSRSVSRPGGSRNGLRPAKLVHLRHLRRWRGSPALVHAQRQHGERTAQCFADDLSEYRRQFQCPADHEWSSGRNRDAEFRHLHQRSIVVHLHRRFGPHGKHTVDAHCAECDVLHDGRASDQCRLRLFRQLVQRYDRSVRDSSSRSTRTTASIFVPWYTYAPAGAGAGAAGQRWYTASAPGICAGFPFDPAGDLRNHPGRVRHTDGACPDQRGGGYRNARLPKLFDCDIQLQLHRRKQQRPVRNHSVDPNRSGASRLRVLNQTS